MEATVPRASRALYLLLGPLLGAWLTWRFRIRVTMPDAVRDLGRPILFLPNHVNYWDPFLLAFAVGRPVHFIAADDNFRSRLMRRLMRAAGAIPKAKARTDVEAIRIMRALVDAGEHVAVFTEGQRTWDGRSRTLVPGAEKLARVLGAPVVGVHLAGAYLSTPRWSRRLRRGTLEIRFRRIADRHAVRTMRRTDLARAIAEAHHFSETRWQAEAGVRFTSPRRAEHAEYALFLCPTCGGDRTLRSAGNDLTCTACGASTWFAPSGRLFAWSSRGGERNRRPHRFTDVADWNAWQLAELHRRVRAAHDAPAPRHLYRAAGVAALTGFRSRPLTARGATDVTVTTDRFRLDGALSLDVPVEAVRAYHVQLVSQFECYVENRLIVLRIEPPWQSAYLLEQTLAAIAAARQSAPLRATEPAPRD